jgi:cyclopropane fatty-acyl-phospholipid synthase-like methyltransferase
MKHPEDMDHSEFAASIFDKYAEGYQSRFMDISAYHDSLDVLLAAISVKAAKVLEVACGPGNVTQYLLQKRPDLQILGTDLSPNMLVLAQSNNPTAQFELLDGRAIFQVSGQLDAIVAAFFFPYISKEEALRFIQDAAAKLESGGVLYISTMEDDYAKSGLRISSQGDEIFMHFHEAGYLNSELKACGFDVLDQSRVRAAGPDGDVDLVLIARKTGK